jgi:hypothetical protein
MCFRKLILNFVFLLVTAAAFGQACPTNISFEDGTFNKWDCYAGSIARNGAISLGAPGAPVSDRHVMYKTHISANT